MENTPELLEKPQLRTLEKDVIGGQNSSFKLKEAWAIRVRLQLQRRVRELARFDLGLDSQLRACDLAKTIGVPIQKVFVRLGDSAYPVSSGSGGQWGANRSTVRHIRGVHESARESGPEARDHSGRRGVCRRHGPRQRPHSLARKGGRCERPRG